MDNYLLDSAFLKKVDLDKNKIFYVKIIVLDKEENPISSIQGRVSTGNVNIDGNSSIRRTCNLTFVAEKANNDLTNIDNLLSANKKIKIIQGLENNIDDKYDKILWFPLGIFVITNPSISHSSAGVTISLSCKDKMCMLNGECGGGLPTSITFHEYDQMIGYREVDAIISSGYDPSTIVTDPKDYIIYKIGQDYWSWSITHGWVQEENADAANTIVTIPQRIYDIIQTLVCNYGNEPISKIFISDVPVQIKQLVRWKGSSPLYYNTKTSEYTTIPIINSSTQNNWIEFKNNQDVGYIYTDFVYPGELISNIGDNVCNILDKIVSVLGNYEYFYDVDGNFHFQEIKNYLNNSYDPTDIYRIDNNGKPILVEGQIEYLALADNNLSILDNLSYQVDFNSNNKSVYIFDENNGLVTSYSNSPNYTNLKNDYHIWGKNEDGYAIHYHLVIKEKPKIMNAYRVYDELDDNGKYTGRIKLEGT